MKFAIILSILCGLAIAEPRYSIFAVSPYNYLGVPVGYDGRILDTPEVAQAKAEHLATQAYEAVRNTLGYAHVPFLTRVYAPAITYGAPIGPDGRVVDTPEVTEAKIAHFVAHALEPPKKLGQYPYGALALFSTMHYAYAHGHGAPLGPNGNVIDTPEVAKAKAEHLAAHAKETARIAEKL